MKNELNALKIYLLILALRDRKFNYAKVGYERIIEYTGIQRNDIKAATSFLTSLNLVRIDSEEVKKNVFSTVNIYRPSYLEPNKHRATLARA